MCTAVAIRKTPPAIVSKGPLSSLAGRSAIALVLWRLFDIRACGGGLRLPEPVGHLGGGPRLAEESRDLAGVLIGEVQRQPAKAIDDVPRTEVGLRAASVNASDRREPALFEDMQRQSPCPLLHEPTALSAAGAARGRAFRAQESGKPGMGNTRLCRALEPVALWDRVRARAESSQEWVRAHQGRTWQVQPVDRLSLPVRIGQSLAETEPVLADRSLAPATFRAAARRSFDDVRHMGIGRREGPSVKFVVRRRGWYRR
jgi:hypothetical protein